MGPFFPVMFNPQDEFDESVNKRAKMQSLYSSVAYITIMGRIKKKIAYLKMNW